MTMKKGPSPALLTLTSGTLASGGLTSVGATATVLTSALTGLFAAVPTSLAAVLAPIAGSLAAMSGPLTVSVTPTITAGLDFGAGVLRGVQDVFWGGDLLTELLSVLGSGGTTTTIVAAPTVAPCPFC